MAVEHPEVAAVVEREVRIAARPETVFEFFVDPDKMILWKGRRAELDATPGGVYRVEINDQAVARGEYVEIEPPSTPNAKPSEPMRKPGLASATTNPSYQRIAFRSWRSSTTASATSPPCRD